MPFVVILLGGRCLTISPNFEIAKNNMAIALTDLGTKVLAFPLIFSISYIFFPVFAVYNLVISIHHTQRTIIWAQSTFVSLVVIMPNRMN
jgi:hypothetical protein